MNHPEKRAEHYSQRKIEKHHRKELLLESLRHIEVGDSPPHLISIIGPNRSGTTAFTEIFARLGIPNYLQPIKSIRRAVQENDAVPQFELHQDIPLAVHKETLGSSQESEFFDPIETLLQAGYPPEKLHLIAMLRDPALTLTSWNRIYQEKVNVPGLIQAIHQTADIAQHAKELGIHTTHYVHEMARDNHAETVAAHIFQRVGINAENRQALHQAVDWTQGPRFGSQNSTGIFYDEPPEIFVEGVKTKPGYVFDAEQQVNITPQQHAFLLQNGVYRVYEQFAQQAVRNTGLKLKMHR